MASNDLMMRIRLLVDSGRATAELKRIDAQIRSLASSIKSLESNRILPLASEIDAVKRSVAGLKSVNIGNFATELDKVRTAFAGIGLQTGAIDGLKAKYAALNSEIESGKLKRFQQDLASAKTALQQTGGEIVKAQNAIRNLRAEKSFDKLNTDSLNASLKVSRARLALMRDDLRRLRKDSSGLSAGDIEAKAKSIEALNRSILERTLKAAKQQKDLFDTYEKQTREKGKELAQQQGIANLKRSEIAQIKEKIAAQKEIERSLANEIKQLTKVAGAQAASRKALLESQLSSAKGDRSQLRSQLRDLENEARAEIARSRAIDQASRALGRQKQELTTLGRLFRGTSGVAREFGAALKFALGPQMAGFAAAGSVISLISGFFAANKEIENLNRGLNSITGSGTLYFEELRRIADSTGQSLIVVTDSFLQLVAASKGTRLEGEATRRIFEAVSRALVVTGADAVRSRRAFLALAQMMSKGQIYAEELRQQLSEALPGAVQIFSRALEISPQKLLDLMKRGKVSSDALILFMQQLEKEVPKVGEELFTFSQKSALLQNELQRLFVEIGKTGIWRALGDAIISARDFIGDLADGTGAFGDAAKREIGEIVALFKTVEFSGQDVFGGLIDGVNRFASEFGSGVIDGIKQIPSLINDVSFSLKQITIRVSPEIEPQKLDKLKKDLQEFGNRAILAGDLDRKFGLTFEDLDRYWENFKKKVSEPLPLPSFEQWRRDGGAAIESQIRDLKELEGILQNKLGRRVDWFGADEEEAKKIAQRISDVRSEIAGLERQSVQSFEASKRSIEDNNKAMEENLRLSNDQKKASDEISQNTEFLKGFDPRARASINDAYKALSNYQRASETVLRLEKESDQAILEKVKSSKNLLDIQNEITDATIKATEAQRALDKNRAKDATDLLNATLSQADAVRQAEENAKKLRQGRQEAGIYFTPEQKKASEDELRGMKLRSKAHDELEKAAKEANQEIKDGYLENAKLLLEQSNDLLVNAGNTYLLKQNNEDLLGVQKQLSSESKTQRENEEKKKRGLELLAQAQELLDKSSGYDVPASVRDEYLGQVEDLAKKAQAIFADIGLFDKLKDSSDLREAVAKSLDESAGELNKRIGEQVKKFNESTKQDAETAIAALSKSANALLAIQSELEGKIVGLATEEARSQLKSRRDDALIEIKALEREYQQIFKRLQDAGKNPTEIGFIKEQAKFPVDADTTKAEESVNGTIKKINESEATLRVNVRYNDPGFSNGTVSDSATDTAQRTGGPIHGYGGGDRIRALLEPGEFVLRKEAVRAIGLDRLFEMNRQKRFPRSPRVRDRIGIPRMSTGGAVPGSPITINVPGRAPIRLSGSRDQAEALANLLTGVGRAL